VEGIYYKNGDKTDCSNYRGISPYQVHTKCYPIFKVTSYIDEITGGYQWGFQYKRTTSDQIFSTHPVWEKK
jgi:hypothetical protein